MYLLCRNNDFVIYKFNDKRTALKYAQELRQIYPNVNYYVKEVKNKKTSTQAQFIVRWKEQNKMKIRKNKNTITTQIKRSELLSKLRCLGGSSWCSKEKFNTDLALKKVNTAIADLLSHQNLYGFYPDRDYEVKLTKRQMDLMFVFYSYINDGRFNDAYHELWDSIEKLWETYGEDDYLAYDELVAIYGLLFTFKLAVELAELKTSNQNIKEELENAKLRLNILEYEEAEEQRALAKLFEERIDTESNLFLGDYEDRIIKDLLSGTLKINELCFAERTGNKSFYIFALRFARDSKNNEEYKQVLELLQSDINHLSEGRLKENLASVYDGYKDYLNILDDNADVVQIDIEKEFNQMVKDYNQPPENISINPLEIEAVDGLIKQNETSEMEKAMMLTQEIKQNLQKVLTNNMIAKELDNQWYMNNAKQY